MMAAPLRPILNWGRAVVDFLYPPVCPLCWRRLARDEKTLCHPCRGEIALRPEWRCNRCGAAGVGAAPEPGRRCRLCPPEGAAWQGVFSVGRYGDHAARCVHLFKYNRRVEIGELMAAMMAAHLADPIRELGGRLDLVAPVPLHWLRRRTRGFNQSEVLARVLAKATDLEYAPRLLRRVRWTRRQALLPKESRAANVAGAFAPRRGIDVDAKGILLVDDVVTTGHTIEECARVLREAGAREVWVASFARAGVGQQSE